jgi:quercetin dioxygenase-like cupin family protein
VIAAGQPPSRIRLNVVRFAPGARNAWHAHAAGQTVHVTEGIGRIRSRGGDVLEIRPGDTVCTPPGERHWHGAAPESQPSFPTQRAPKPGQTTRHSARCVGKVRATMIM